MTARPDNTMKHVCPWDCKVWLLNPVYWDRLFGVVMGGGLIPLGGFLKC